MEAKTGFWRNFTFRKWAISTLIVLSVYLLGDFTDVFLIKDEEIKNILAIKHFFKNLIFSAFWAFWVTVWTEKSDISGWLKKSENKNPS